MEFIIAQVISVFTTASAVLSMQFKGMKPVLVCQIISNLMCAATFLLLGGLSGMAICSVAILQCIVVFACNVKGIKPPLPILLGFIGAYVVCSLVFFQSFVDVFSAMGAVFFAIGMAQDKASAARRWYLANPVCWLIYDVFTMAYGNVLTHAILFFTTLLAIVRLDLPEYRRKRREQASRDER